MKRAFETLVGPLLGLLFLAAIVPIGGCEGFQFEWDVIEDSVTLYSLARPEFIDQPAAFDFINRRPVVVEQPQQGDPQVFDLAFSEVDGEFVFLPAGLFEQFTISPGIAIESGTPFDELAEAPADGYTTSEPVPVETGVVYVIRTRRGQGGCSRYAKLEVLELETQGVVEFRQIRNNLCNDRELIQPDDE